MCGIAGFHQLDDRLIDRPGRFANELLRAIESRGRDATGLLYVTADGKEYLDKRAVTAARFIANRKGLPAPRTALLHTRWATTGERKSARDAHPQVSGRTAAVHNGTVFNDTELFTAFRLKRRAKVDSEVIPAMIQHAGWDQAESALSLMEGGIATAVVNFDNPGQLLLAKVRHYPLHYCHVERHGLLVFASTAYAIKSAWQHAYGGDLHAEIIELGVGECIRANGKLERTTIPGVYGVEKERVYVPKDITPYARKQREAVSKAAGQKQLPAGSTRKTESSKAKTRPRSAAEDKLRADAARAGTQNTTGEIDRLLDQLEKVQTRLGRLEDRMSLYEVDAELDALEEADETDEDLLDCPFGKEGCYGSECDDCAGTVVWRRMEREAARERGEDPDDDLLGDGWHDTPNGGRWRRRYLGE